MCLGRESLVTGPKLGARDGGCQGYAYADQRFDFLRAPVDAFLDEAAFVAGWAVGRVILFNMAFC
jgi:hypothetical protein